MKPSATDAPPTKAHEGERFKRLIAVLGLNQDTFAAASGGKLSRVEVNHACTGKNDYRTDKWLGGIAAAAGASMGDVYAWRQHEIDEAELVRRARHGSQGVVSIPAIPQISAGTFLMSIKAHPGLERAIAKHPEKWSLATVAQAVGAPYKSDSDGNPEGGWIKLLNELAAGGPEAIGGADELEARATKPLGLPKPTRR